MRPHLALVLAVAGVLLAAGTAAAAGGPRNPAISVSAQEPTDPIPPDRIREIPLQVKGNCQHVGPAEVAFAGDRDVHLSTATEGTSLSAEVDPVVTLPRRPCEGGWVTEEATLQVRTSPGAPAFHVSNIRLTARNDDTSSETEVPVQVGYGPKLQTDPPDAPVPAEAGSTVDVPLAVANTGNGQSRIRFQVAEAAAPLTVQAPSPPTLPPERGSAGNPVRLLEVPVTVDDDAPTGDALPVTLELTPVYALDKAYVGPPFEATFAVTVDGSASAAQAALLPAAGAAILAGGAAVVRIRSWG